jgi:hypothetical protein
MAWQRAAARQDLRLADALAAGEPIDVSHLREYHPEILVGPHNANPEAYLHGRAWHEADVGVGGRCPSIVKPSAR